MFSGVNGIPACARQTDGQDRHLATAQSALCIAYASCSNKIVAKIA